MSIATFVDVEAALLNSGNEPKGEIVEALRAVVRFARAELDADDDDLVRFLNLAIEAEEANSEAAP